MRPPGLLWRPPPPHCPKNLEGCAIGITAIPGCAMPPLHCMPSTYWALLKRHMLSHTGYVVFPTQTEKTCRSCVVSGQPSNCTWKLILKAGDRCEIKYARIS